MKYISLTDTDEYKKYGYKIVDCPVCGEKTLDNHWICQNCGWEYDGTFEESEYSSCNQTTLEKYKKQYIESSNTKNNL